MTNYKFSEAIATLIPLASVLARNNFHYSKLLGFLQKISDECEKWQTQCNDEGVFSNDIKLELDVTSGSLSLEEWRNILSVLKVYVNRTQVSFQGKFYRMKIFGLLNQAIILVSPHIPNGGWRKASKVFHDFSNFPKI
jgi:hypothetical protein